MTPTEQKQLKTLEKKLEHLEDRLREMYSIYGAGHNACHDLHSQWTKTYGEYGNLLVKLGLLK